MHICEQGATLRPAEDLEVQYNRRSCLALTSSDPNSNIYIIRSYAIKKTEDSSTS